MTQTQTDGSLYAYQEYTDDIDLTNYSARDFCGIERWTKKRVWYFLKSERYTRLHKLAKLMLHVHTLVISSLFYSVHLFMLNCIVSCVVYNYLFCYLHNIVKCRLTVGMIRGREGKRESGVRGGKIEGCKSLEFSKVSHDETPNKKPPLLFQNAQKLTYKQQRKIQKLSGVDPRFRGREGR